jgi:hypothetical protein
LDMRISPSPGFRSLEDHFWTLSSKFYRLEADYALLLKANQKLGFRILDDAVAHTITQRDLTVARDHRDRLIESNRALRFDRDSLLDRLSDVTGDRNAAFKRLETFSKVMTDAAAALGGAK